MQHEEEWRVVVEAPGYVISSLGRLARRHLNWRGEEERRILKPGINRGGYFHYVLSCGGEHRARTAHNLVCTAWHGPKPSPDRVCAHGDGNPKNNHPDNLRWATPKENSEDRERHGRTWRGGHTPVIAAALSGDNHWTKRHPERVPRGETFWRTGTHGIGAFGERMACAKLTEEQVKVIRAEPKVHGSGRMLAEKFGVSMALISAIRKGRAWAYLDK